MISQYSEGTGVATLIFLSKEVIWAVLLRAKQKSSCSTVLEKGSRMVCSHWYTQICWPEQSLMSTPTTEPWDSAHGSETRSNEIPGGCRKLLGEGKGRQESLPAQTKQPGSCFRFATHQAEGRAESEGNWWELCSTHALIMNETGKIGDIQTKDRLTRTCISLLKGHTTKSTKSTKSTVNISCKISNGKKWRNCKT